MKKTIIVLDNYTQKVHVYQNAVYDENKAEDFVIMNHKLERCNWMVVDKLELIIETK